MTARCPEDLLAAVPVVLGFVPEHSVVMLTFGAARPFHARVDLPPVVEDLPAMVSLLVGPARRHRVPRALFVLYTADAELADWACAALLLAFAESGTEVVDVIRADGARWYPMLHPGDAAGVAYDISHHRFAVQSVVEGRVTHSSRAELAATLLPLPDRVAAVEAARATALSPPPEPEAAWACGVVRQHIGAGTIADDQEVARLLRDLHRTEVRDAVWTLIDRAHAEPHVTFWSDVVRRTPHDLLAAPAALLAFAAWLCGHGALAWCALDRCWAAEPDYRLAAYLAQALTHAVPPEAWEPP